MIELLISSIATLVAFLLGVTLGYRQATWALLGILEREGVEPRDLPDELRWRVRHRSSARPSTGG